MQDVGGEPLRRSCLLPGAAAPLVIPTGGRALSDVTGGQSR